MKLSVIIITKNEIRNIAACLKCVSFADEVIVVDSGSTDGTIDQAKQMGATVIITPDWPGFGPQKSRALTAAKGDWILSVDADERVSAKLQREVLATIAQPSSTTAFFLPRLTNFFGKWIKHSGWYPDYHIRLFRRDSARFSPDLVHESVVVTKGEIGHLTAPLIHYSLRSQSEFLRKMTQYSILGAEQAYTKGRRSSLSKAIVFSIIDFTRMYIWRRGFLDGREGLIIAILSAEAMFQKYLGLALLDTHAAKANAAGEEPTPPAKYVE